MSDFLWDAEAAKYLALTREARLRWMAKLLFALTMFARDTYTVGGLGLDDPERMRRFNELTHRATDQLRNQLDNIVGLPEETFMKMIGEGIQELGIGVPNILAILQR
jgi:hypothetical protein